MMRAATSPGLGHLYARLRNIQPALQVVERVWKAMDSNVEDSWDWERIMNHVGTDFLIT